MLGRAIESGFFLKWGYGVMVSTRRYFLGRGYGSSPVSPQIGCIAVWYISRFIEARTILFAALQHRRPGTAQGLVPFTGWRFFKKRFCGVARVVLRYPYFEL